MTYLLILFGKIFIFLSSFLNLGSGSTWPGHIALNTDENFTKNILKNNKHLKIILIAGTNGKTTTGKLIKTVLEGNDNKVFQNEAGANLLNGIASSLIKNSSLTGKLNYNYAIFEIDENTLPQALGNINPEVTVLLNLFRDQLDRYGEVNIISEKWRDAIRQISLKNILILNADDPQIAYLGEKARNKTLYFGVKSGDQTTTDHASDSTYCPKCRNKLNYKSTSFSHLGNWSCSNCSLKRPKLNTEDFDLDSLPGLYNKYNLNATVLTARELGISSEKIKKSLINFKPAFGRQEIIKFNNKNIQIFLSKNPASFNQSLQTINELKARNLLLILNDRIPDGRDVSWIWDVDFENNLKDFKSISVSGDRVYDMALRLKYADRNNLNIYEVLGDAVKNETAGLNKDETLYILPTYSAMLDLRKILIGRKIL